MEILLFISFYRKKTKNIAKHTMPVSLYCKTSGALGAITGSLSNTYKKDLIAVSRLINCKLSKMKTNIQYIRPYANYNLLSVQSSM